MVTCFRKNSKCESTTEDQLNDLTKTPKFGMKKISEFNSSSNAGSTVGATVETDYLTCYSYDNFNRLTHSLSKGTDTLYQYNA